MSKKKGPSLAELRTISFLDGLTDLERAEREEQEEEDRRKPHHPYSRKDVAEIARKRAANPPGFIAEDVKLEEAPPYHVVLVSVGKSQGSVVDKYACVYLSELQLDKLTVLLNERARRKNSPEPQST